MGEVKMHLLDLPDLVLEHIFSFLSYDEVAKKRIICRRVDRINQGLLNRGFIKMTRRHAADLKTIKQQLPRRESERRNHPLAKHSDILTCIETRLSMLSMTYTKYMDLDLCCFIPGRVIDEVFNILAIVENTKTSLRAHEVLQELRDISSMAIEHFDDKIAPTLKRNFLSAQSTASTSHDSSGCSYSPDRSLSEKLVGYAAEKQEPACSMARSNRTIITKLDNSYKQALRKARAMVQIQTKQMLQIKNQTVTISELKAQVSEMKKRLDEYEVKNREMAATITQMKVEASTSGAGGPPGDASGESMSSPSSKTRNIKPRTATIILKRRINESPPSEAIKKSRLTD